MVNTAVVFEQHDTVMRQDGAMQLVQANSEKGRKERGTRTGGREGGRGRLEGQMHAVAGGGGGKQYLEDAVDGLSASRHCSRCCSPAALSCHMIACAVGHICQEVQG